MHQGAAGLVKPQAVLSGEHALIPKPMGTVSLCCTPPWGVLLLELQGGLSCCMPSA